MTGLFLIPLLSNLPHSLTIFLELLPSLLSRFIDLKRKRLVRSHTNFMAAEIMFNSAYSLRPKIRVIEKGRTGGNVQYPD